MVANVLLVIGTILVSFVFAKLFKIDKPFHFALLMGLSATFIIWAND